jgi:tetratricopeptide (TPR) repeat protein
MEYDLQNIFPISPSHRLAKFDHKSDKRFELWEFLSQIGFADLSLSATIYDSLRKTIPVSDWRRTIIDIGESKHFSLKGNTLKSFRLLRDVYDSLYKAGTSSDTDLYNELQSIFLFVWLELKTKLNLFENHLFEYRTGQSLTKIDNFRLAYDYSLTRYLVVNGVEPPNKLLDIAYALEDRKLVSLAAAAYREMGNVVRKKKHYEDAHDLFNKSLSLAEENNLEITKYQYLVAVGYLHFSQKHYEQATEIWRQIPLKPSNGVYTAGILENFALVEEAQNNFDGALEFVIEALKLSQRQDNVNRLPGECLYLGENYEKHFNDLDKAEYYLRMGYENCLRYADAGISLVGDRKRVLEAYVDFLKRRDPPSVGKRRTASSDAFAFAQGKSWKTIKETFHQQLIRFHAATSKTGRMLAAKLNMPATTLYSLQTRLKNQGYSLAAPDPHTSEPEHPLQNYIKEHETLSWDEVNAIFERELVHYLYEKYGYNKLRMSKILELSYAIIIEKTRDLTHYNENLLSN